MSRARKWGTASVLGDLLLVVLFIFILLPILWVIVMSFKTNQDILAWPPTFVFKPTLDNYRSVILGISKSATGNVPVKFLNNMLNSLIISTLAVVVSLIIGLPAAYALARLNFKGKENIAFTFLSFRFAPELLVIIPIYLFFQRSALYDTYGGLVLVYQLITLPMIVWIVRSYFEDVPEELEQACNVDGYKWLHTFFKVSLPLVRPGAAAAALLSFIYAWNNFVFALILGSSRIAPVTVGALKFMTAEQIRYGDMSAAVVIAAIPILALAIYLQRYLIRGLSLGAIKA